MSLAPLRTPQSWNIFPKWALTPVICTPTQGILGLTHTYPLSPLSPGTMTGIVWPQEQGLIAVDYYLLLFLSLLWEEAGITAKGNPPPGPGSQLEAPSLEAVPGDLAFTAFQCFAAEKKKSPFLGTVSG